MNILSNLIKSSFLAAIIFWTIIFSENFESEMILFVIISIIPIGVCCSITILFTILPFFWLKKVGANNSDVFKKWFPFYAIVSFSLSFYGVIEEPSLSCFFASAFFTSLQSWVWFVKLNKIKSPS